MIKKRKRTVLSREERLSLEHLGKDAPRTPDIYCDVVFLPREHDLGSPIIASRHVARHLRILYSGKTKITNLNYRVVSHGVPEKMRPRLQIAVFIDEDIARFLRRKMRERTRELSWFLRDRDGRHLLSAHT